MKKISIIAASVLLAATAYCQSARIYRTEFVPFDTREDATANNRNNTVHYLRYSPTAMGSDGKTEIVGETVAIPTSWSDYDVYLHVENTIKAYDLAINGHVVAETDDAYTPADYLISPYLKQGANEISLRLRRADAPELNDDARSNLGEQFAGSYIFAQHKLHVKDYSAAIRFDESGRNAVLSLDVIVRNSFNYPEPVNVGYDIYAPNGKLIDYAVREIVVDGRSQDTLRIRTALGDAKGFAWSSANASLYKLMLYVKRDGKPREYIPFRAGLGLSSFDGQTITRNGAPVRIRSTAFDARTTRKEALESIRALKKQGVNTLIPSNPQPKWFYDLCDGLGMFVIERANINPVLRKDDRRINGTPSNNPALAGEYLNRVKAMYYRTRNHSCIIAYALGGNRAGNGYNMYKAYEWLKSVEPERAVICTTADGEWNTDIDEIK